MDSRVNKKKKNRRSNTKYPALKKQYNLKLRSDYIETDYVNGVVDANGVVVIPPLDEEAKKFLNDFYEEEVNTNFNHIKDYRIRDSLAVIRKEYTPLRKLKTKLIKADEHIPSEIWDRLADLRLEFHNIAEGHLINTDIEEHYRIYTENNERNRCLFNRKKTSGVLNELNNETYNDIHDTIYSVPCSGEILMHKNIPAQPCVIKDC